MSPTGRVLLALAGAALIAHSFTGGVNHEVLVAGILLALAAATA